MIPIIQDTPSVLIDHDIPGTNITMEILCCVVCNLKSYVHRQYKLTSSGKLEHTLQYISKGLHNLF